MYIRIRERRILTSIAYLSAKLECIWSAGEGKPNLSEGRECVKHVRGLCLQAHMDESNQYSFLKIFQHTCSPYAIRAFKWGKDTTGENDSQQLTSLTCEMCYFWIYVYKKKIACLYFLSLFDISFFVEKYQQYE